MSSLLIIGEMITVIGLEGGRYGGETPLLPELGEPVGHLPEADLTCAEGRSGVRPQRSAHQAGAHASASGQGGQERGRSAVAPAVPRRHVHEAPTQPASDARDGSEGRAKRRGARTGRPRGRTSRPSGMERRQLLRGRRAGVGVAEVGAPRRDLDPGIRRRRSHGKPSGWKRSRERRTRGVGRQLAWHTGKSAHGPGRLSQPPALALALPQRYFAALGRPSLLEG